MHLLAKVALSRPSASFLTRLTGDLGGPGTDSLLLRNADPLPEHLPPNRVAFLLPGAVVPEASSDPLASRLLIHLPEELGYLVSGDIVRVDAPTSTIRVLYRRSSDYNAILLTERCNSLCLMCSQPPRIEDDGYRVQEALETIRLMSPDTRHLGITGGEPTLLRPGFLEVVAATRDFLPNARLQVLSNGRMFSYLRYAKDLAELGHPDLILGVPLYAAVPWQHDYVVQAEHAFDQTVRGLMNLARCGIRIQLRMVLHADTYPSLPEFARFVTRNLPFVDHVALMGLEVMGYARTNLRALWVNPLDYKAELKVAVDHLARSGVRPSIFNLPLCLLAESLRPFAAKSISDWKRNYLPACEQCDVRTDCGGLFASSAVHHAPTIRPIRASGTSGQLT